MRRLILMAVLLAAIGLPRVAVAAPTPAKSSVGHLSSIYLVGTLDRRDRPRLFARFDFFAGAIQEADNCGGSPCYAGSFTGP